MQQIYYIVTGQTKYRLVKKRRLPGKFLKEIYILLLMVVQPVWMQKNILQVICIQNMFDA